MFKTAFRSFVRSFVCLIFVRRLSTATTSTRTYLHPYPIESVIPRLVDRGEIGREKKRMMYQRNKNKEQQYKDNIKPDLKN